MNERKEKRTDPRAGVALIVVLGFLSLMLIMALSFLSTAQTESKVSDASQEAIRTRQLLRSALSAAMNDYSRDLWGEKLYLPNDDYKVYASVSSGMDAISGNGRNLRGTQTTLLRGEALDWIPARYKTTDVTNIVNDAEWILVREKPGTKSRILGRYAYVCFDCSGALDANYVAFAEDIGKADSRAISNRTRRTVREVPMGLLPETADAGQFKSYRKGWKGFDSPQMLVKLTDGKAQDGSDSSARWQPERKETYGAGLVSNLVSELTSYSLSAYRGGRYSRNSGSWEKPKYVNPDDGSGWKNALEPLSGQRKIDDASFGKMVKDFTSKAAVPEGVDYPSVKNVPMFNEIFVRNLHLNNSEKKTKTVDGEQVETFEYTATVEVQFEFWYPFPSKGNERSGNFILKAPGLEMSSSGGGSGFSMPVALMSSMGRAIQVTGKATPSVEQISVSAKYNNGKPYVTQAIKYTVVFEPKSEPTIKDGNATLMWAKGWETKGPIDLLYEGEPVDRVPAGLTCGIAGRIVVAQGETHSEKYSLEALDPRLNHLPSDWKDVLTVGGSPEEINECTKNNGTFQKEGAAMYCRNDSFETPADFGFFPTGNPWETLNLLTDEGAEFLALTTMDERVKDALEKEGVFYTNAQLNVNTRCSNALASAFYDISVMEVPGWDAQEHEGVDHMEEETAREFARRIMEVTDKTPFQSGMDWARLPVMKDNGWLAAQGYNRNQRESLLRNTYGLFSVADSLFLAVVVAQSVKEGPQASKVGEWDDEDQITGERRGVALVWRDPFKTGNNLHHEMMVRMFRYLND